MPERLRLVDVVVSQVNGEYQFSSSTPSSSLSRIFTYRSKLSLALTGIV